MYHVLFLLALTGSPLESGDGAARPLDERGVENLVALTRLMGAVRYFHPSDEVLALGWDRFETSPREILRP